MLGPFPEGEIRKHENRALFKLDKGMLLEVTPQRHRQIFTKEKAWLHGYLSADGRIRCGPHYVKYRGKERIVKYRYEIAAYDGDPRYRKLFAEAMKKIYGVNAHDYPKQSAVAVYNKEVAYDLLKYGNYSTTKWSVPFEYLDREAAKMWIRGFFDGDGSATHNHKHVKITATSINKRGLEEIRFLLEKEFGIHAKIQYDSRKNRPETWSDSYNLDITTKNDILKFYQEIGFSEPKQKDLKRLLLWRRWIKE